MLNKRIKGYKVKHSSPTNIRYKKTPPSDEYTRRGNERSTKMCNDIIAHRKEKSNAKKKNYSKKLKQGRGYGKKEDVTQTLNANSHKNMSCASLVVPQLSPLSAW